MKRKENPTTLSKVTSKCNQFWRKKQPRGLRKIIKHWHQFNNRSFVEVVFRFRTQLLCQGDGDLEGQKSWFSRTLVHYAENIIKLSENLQIALQIPTLSKAMSLESSEETMYLIEGKSTNRLAEGDSNKQELWMKIPKKILRSDTFLELMS